MAKKIIIIEASPRAKGNSTILAREVAAGARCFGTEVETVHLHGLDIRPCTACDACQKSLTADCIIDDDMKAIYTRLRSADAIVYATPIYWFTVSAQIKLFMDRCYALTFLGTQPDTDSDEQVETVENDLRGKKLGVVLTFGDVDPFASGAVNAIRTFQDMARYVGAEIFGFVYGSALGPGEVADNADLMKQAFNLGRALATDA